MWQERRLLVLAGPTQEPAAAPEMCLHIQAIFAARRSGTSCTNANRDPISYGQWEDGNTLSVTTTLSIGGSDYTYAFCLSKFSGSNPTGLTVRVKSESAAPSCTGSCTGTCSTLVNNGQVAIEFNKICSNDATKVCTASSDCSSGGTCQEEVRYGIIQKYADKNQDYTYDSDAVRFGLREVEQWSR